MCTPGRRRRRLLPWQRHAIDRYGNAGGRAPNRLDSPHSNLSRRYFSLPLPYLRLLLLLFWFDQRRYRPQRPGWGHWSATPATPLVFTANGVSAFNADLIPIWCTRSRLMWAHQLLPVGLFIFIDRPGLIE